MGENLAWIEGECEKAFVFGLSHGSFTVLSTTMSAEVPVDSLWTFIRVHGVVCHKTVIFCAYVTVNPQSMTYELRLDSALTNICIYLTKRPGAA